MPITLLDETEMETVLGNLASQLIHAHPEPEKLMLAGIQRRGADLATRLVARLARPLPLASLDINLYRDDWTRLAGGVPGIGESFMPCSPDGRIVVLVDDVLFSGRTARAAMEAILDYGRPDKIELMTFIDRGHRELPICANYIGKTIETRSDQHIDVLLKERDGRDAVILTESSALQH